MKREVVAAGLSLALHAAGLALFWEEADAPVALVPGRAQKDKPVQIEVMRLAALVSPPAAKPVEPVAPVAPQPRRPVSKPAVAGGVAGAVAVDPGSAPAREGKGAPPSAAGASSIDSEEARSGDGAPIDTAALSARLQRVALTCYPAAARRFHQTGEAQIRFCLDAAGVLRESTLIRSAGSELLDHAARDCVVPGAAPFGPETFGRCFTVPVRFKP